MKKYIKPSIDIKDFDFTDIIMVSNGLPTDGKSDIGGATVNFDDEWKGII